MILNNIKVRQKDGGFTIVELLVVIVVIGILAAITIISYAGITARANSSSEQAAANAMIQKAEAYAADTGAYPLTAAAMTGATSDKVYALTGITAVQGTAMAAAPAAPPANSVSYYRCGTVGVSVGYWNFQTNVLNFIHSGTSTGGTAILVCTGGTITAT